MTVQCWASKQQHFHGTRCHMQGCLGKAGRTTAAATNADGGAAYCLPAALPTAASTHCMLRSPLPLPRITSLS